MKHTPKTSCSLPEHAHTPGPWQVIMSPQTVNGVTHSGPDLRKGWPRIIGPDGHSVADVVTHSHRPAHANAEFICRAVNSHADLLQALRTLLDHVTQFQRWQRDGKPCGELFKNLDTTQARAAIRQGLKDQTTKQRKEHK